ncbi:unnamed protein product [Sympodiomycopsis kandeliae]
MPLTRSQTETEYPQIDSDPHFRRVVKYFRPSDYGVWGASAGAFPAALYWLEAMDPHKIPKGGLAASMKLGGFLGACGGFLMAYQRSSARFWGFAENTRELNMAKEEAVDFSQLHSALDPYMQGVAHRNSVWSQLKFSVMPWFNVVNHQHHGPGPQSQEE